MAFGGTGRKIMCYKTGVTDTVALNGRHYRTTKYSDGSQQVEDMTAIQATNVQSALNDIAQGLTWRERAQPGDIMMIDQNGEQVPATYHVQEGTGNFIPIGMEQIYNMQNQAVDYLNTNISNLHTTVSDNVSLSNISLSNAGMSNLAVNSDIEELKDEIQLLKDEIENLKMLLLEN